MKVSDLNDLATALDGDLVVHFRFIGEGFDGDFDPYNPDDAPVYHVDVDIYVPAEGEDWPGSDDDHADKWAATGATSTVTGIDALAGSPTQYKALARKIASMYAEVVEGERTVTEVCHDVSLMSLKDA